MGEPPKKCPVAFQWPELKRREGGRDIQRKITKKYKKNVTNKNMREKKMCIQYIYIYTYIHIQTYVFP